MNFRAKIWMLPLSAAALFVIGSGVSFAVGTRTVAALDHLREVDYPVLESMTRIERTLEQFRLSLQSAAAEGDDSKIKEAQALAETAIAGLGTLEKLEGPGGPAAALRHAFEPYQAAALVATRAMLANTGMSGQLARMQTTLQALDKQQAVSKKAATEGVTRAQDAVAAGVRRNLWVGLGTGAAVLLVLGIASRLVLASVWRDLGAEPALLRHRVQQIADGDLSSQDAAMAAAQPGSLGRALAAMGSQLSATVGQIRQSSDSIATASGEIASGNRDLNQRTEHAASNLQQAANSMQQLAGTVRQSADSAALANQLANAAAGAARDGGGIVAQVVANMQEINDASRRITEIIGVIDGIAFQTNILALNAAVEAARAGEQGRGFAVVATEVRSLAQRCTQAAKEIKGLIGLSSSKVDSGARLVGEAGTAMQKIVDGVQRVSDIIGEISAATTAQSSGIGSITDSVGQLDRMTQQNASMVAQSATAAGSLREEADRLAQAVGVFKLQEVA